ncbi:DNA-processing protein DprA [Acidithiobacillus caldus]
MNSATVFETRSISPARELGAYEELWVKQGQSFRSLFETFKQANASLPSQLVEATIAQKRAVQVLRILRDKSLNDVNFIVSSTIDYPSNLRDAKYHVQFLYCRGNLNVLHMPLRVAIVGSRNASEKGLRRAQKLARCIAKDGGVVVSGLARGIDTAAHLAAIEAGGQTMAVIGTPISEAYPPENKDLQERIARDYLLVSQVPIIRYRSQTPKWNRLFFPERNITMSALSHATVIVEAGETSGSLIQARAALEQGRKLFILESCFHNNLKWPERMVRNGAIRVREYEQIRSALFGEPYTH